MSRRPQILLDTTDARCLEPGASHLLFFPERRLRPASVAAFLFVVTEAGFDDAVVAQVKALPQVEEVHLIGGDETYLVRVGVDSLDELHFFIRRHFRRRPGIRSIRILGVRQTLKGLSSQP